MDIRNLDLKKRILEISYKKHLSHIGSCLTAVDILDDIYSKKKENELFILSNGHAGLALYTILEKYCKLNAEILFDKHGVHPNRDVDNFIWASTGSLGHGIGIAVGMALANRHRKVYCMLSDGEMAEGSVYETFNTAREQSLSNLEIHINCNGYTAYRKVFQYRTTDFTSNYQTLNIKVHCTEFEFPFLKGIEAHYYILTDKDYQLVQSL